MRESEWKPSLAKKTSCELNFRAFTKPGPDRIGSDRIDKTRTGSDWFNKTWIRLRPIDKTRTGSEKNRFATNISLKWSRDTSIEMA